MNNKNISTKYKYYYTNRNNSFDSNKMILVNKNHIQEIKNLLYDLWGEQGNYSDNFYYKIVFDQLSYVYIENKKIVAVSLIEKINKNGIVMVDVLGVDKNYRGKGLGQNLLKKCIEICMSKGFYIFQLHVATSNPAAIHIYTKLGFKQKGNVILDYYCNDPEGERDAFFMVLDKTKENKEIKAINNINNNIYPKITANNNIIFEQFEKINRYKKEEERKNNFEIKKQEHLHQNFDYVRRHKRNNGQTFYNPYINNLNNINNNKYVLDKNNEGIDHQVFCY